jgi:hydroxymethylglutaryl-CoA lyase
MKTIKIHEVGMRDGLQMEKQVIPTKIKIEWIKKLLKSGLDIIQLGSFVHPKYVPQMADTDELFHYFNLPGNKPANVILSGLVLNGKGLDRAMACGVEMVCMGVSASETHSKKNTNMSTDRALSHILSIVKLARAEKIQIQLAVQSAFGCGYEGPISEEQVVRIAARYIEEGFTNISLADTAGHANPAQVKHLFERLLKLDDSLELTGHFHNTYGLAIANCFAAMEVGVSMLETSFGGLGGCPFTSIAGGNASTDDLVHMLQRMDQRHDINLDVFIETARKAAQLLNKDLPGMVYKTGTIKQAVHV